MIQPALTELDAVIEAYEMEQQRRGQADLSAFLPASGHPRYRHVLRELVRVDLEYGWRSGRPRRLEDYLKRYPELSQDPDSLREIAFEELRLRRQAGESPSPAEYQQRFGIVLCGDAGPAAPPRLRQDEPTWKDGKPLSGPASLAVPRGPEQSADLTEAGRAYRDYCRTHAGNGTDHLDSWCASYAGGPEHAQLFREVHRSDPKAAGRLAEALTSMPEAGDQFLDFRLISELGRGAFARVFLAQQGELANRQVVLKISSDGVGESQTLAQLQHTNIVPIYSIHRAGLFQAVCMPYFGSTTLQDVYTDLESLPALPASGKGLVSTLHAHRSTTQLSSGARPLSPSAADTLPPGATEMPPNAGSAPVREAPATLKTLEQFTYVQAVVWIAARLADGLGHAHDRGILHRDLKPANILLTDEGQPMLLDFNLSQDSKVRGTASGALIGGTLPYMAPEHLDAFRGNDRPVDARSDVYSLGIMLYELLTRRHPFPTQRGPLREAVPRMIAERRQAPPGVRRWNPAVPLAVESIVVHCLEPDPARRYQSAHELREDLERHLDNRPLKFAPDPSRWQRIQKWCRRHPRVTAALQAGAAVLVLALATGAGMKAYHSVQERKAEGDFAEFRKDSLVAEALLNTQRRDPLLTRDEAVRAGRECLQRYRVLDDPAWQRAPAVRYLRADDGERLRGRVGELLLLMARAAAEEAAAQPERGKREDQYRNALVLNQRAEECFAGPGAPALLWRQRGELEKRLGRAEVGEALLQQADALAPRSARDRYLRAAEFVAREDYQGALPLLRAATHEEPQNYGAWFVLGYCYYELGKYADADTCYSVCIVLWPDHFWPYLRRGMCRIRHRDFPEALADLNEAVRLRPNHYDLYLNRALAHEGLHDHAKAVADLTLAIDLGSPLTRLYFMRSYNRRQIGDQEGAERDFAEGMRRQPTDENSWLDRAYYKMQKNDLDGALGDYQQALKLNPKSFLALQNISHLLSRNGRTDEALRVLDREIALYPDQIHARSGRGVLLARLGKNTEAYKDAEASLRTDHRPSTLYQVAGIYALTSRTNQSDRAKALELLASALRQGFGHDLLGRDKDLDPIRDLPEFKRLAQAAQGLVEAVPARKP